MQNSKRRRTPAHTHEARKGLAAIAGLQSDADVKKSRKMEVLLNPTVAELDALGAFRAAIPKRKIAQ